MVRLNCGGVIAVLLGMAALAASVPGASASTTRARRDVTSVPLPREILFHEDHRGLVTRIWINGAGPFEFAIDTGAGALIVSQDVAARARLVVERAVSVTGLSGRTSKAHESAPVELAVGSSSNRLPVASRVTVVSGLPADVDGLLDPSIAFWPLGFELDVAGGSLRVFDPGTSPIDRSDVPDGGAVTTWETRGGSRRPFIMLGGGLAALIDTGSMFGMAVGPVQARSLGIAMEGGETRSSVGDVGGGIVQVRRTTTRRVTVGGMILQNVPTDVLSGTAPGTPVLFGRDALRPFVIAFDPKSRLIRFALR